MSAIFISYRRADNQYAAQALNDHLKQCFGEEEVYFDTEKIPFGSDYFKVIYRKLEVCQVVLAVIGDEWVTAKNKESGELRLFELNDLVRREIERGLERQIPVIPVLIEEATIPAKKDLPDSIEGIVNHNAAEFRSGPDRSHHLQLLVERLEQIIGIQGKEAPKPPAPNEPAEPSPSEGARPPDESGLKPLDFIGTWEVIHKGSKFALSWMKGFEVEFLPNNEVIGSSANEDLELGGEWRVESGRLKFNIQNIKYAGRVDENYMAGSAALSETKEDTWDWTATRKVL